MLANILKSVTKNIDTRIKNPVIGAFVSSWMICNWAKLALLFWGKGNLGERIQAFNASIDSEYSTTLWIPLLITALYLFFLPLINLAVQAGTKWVDVQRHAAAVSLDVAKQKELSELNKEKFKANPDNGFIKKELDLEFALEEKKKEILEIEKNEKEEKRKTSEAERLKSEEELKIKENQREKSDLELKKHQRNEEREKEKRERETAQGKRMNIF